MIRCPDCGNPKKSWRVFDDNNPDWRNRTLAWVGDRYVGPFSLVSKMVCLWCPQCDKPTQVELRSLGHGGWLPTDEWLMEAML